MSYRFIKSLHGWLGLFAWPWILMIALTGLYQNHQDAIDPWLPGDPMTAARLSALPAHPVAAPDFPDAEPVTVFGHPGWQAADGSEGLDAVTGARWTSGSYLTTWTAPDGTRIGWRMDWQKLALRLHRAGWAGDGLGTWPADLVALGLCTFAVTGLWLFVTSKLRRWWRR